MKVKTVAVAVGLVAVLAAGGLMLGNRIAGQRVAALADRGIALLPPGIEAKYQDISYSLLTGVATVTGLTLTSQYNGASGVETIDRIEIAGVPWSLGDQVAQIQTAPRTLTRDSVFRVADRVTISGIRSSAPKLKLILQKLAIAGIRVHPYALVQPAVPSVSEIIRQVTSPPPNLDGPNGGAVAVGQATKLLRFAAAAALALEYDNATETGLEEDVTIPATADEPEEQEHFSLARVDLPQGLHNAVIGPAYDQDLREAGSDHVQLGFAHFDLGGFDVRAPAERLVAGGSFSGALLDGLKVGDLAISGITAEIPAAGHVTISRIGIDGIDFGHEVLQAAHIAVDHMHLPEAALARTPASAAAMRELDVHALTISASGGYHWDVAHEAVTIDHTALTIDELGALDFEGQVEGVSPAIDLQRLENEIILRQARLHYRDASLAGRLIAASAARAQVDVPAMRQHLIDTVEMRALSLGSGPAFAEIVNAVTSFIQAPHSLSVAIKPPVALPISDLLMQQDQDPRKILDRLGVTVTANQ